MTSPSDDVRLARTNGHAEPWREAPPPPRPRKLVALHWLTVLCLVAGVTLVLARDQLDGRVVRGWLLEGHRYFGLIVLLLFVVRVALRVRLGKLPSHGHSPKLLRILAGLTHVLLYALLLALPLLGWALSNAGGKPVDFLGIRLPSLVGPDEDLADNLQAWHVDLAWLLLGVASMHFAGALWHHFVRRDGVLRTMLPRRRR